MESNIKSRHVKGKSMNINSENKQIKLQALKDKMENPFWIPTNNADLFVVKQIYKDDRKIQKAIGLSKTKIPMSKFKNLEDNFSINNLKNFSNTFLTEQAKMNSTTETKNESHTNTFGTSNQTNLLEQKNSFDANVS